MRHNLDTGDFRRFVRGEATARGGEERAVALIGAQRSEALGFQDRVRAVGDCYDNAMCESFFATLECELLDRVRFRCQSEARIAIFDFIEGFYNPRRRHSALGYLSPIEFERAQAA